MNASLADSFSAALSTKCLPPSREPSCSPRVTQHLLCPAARFTSPKSFQLVTAINWILKLYICILSNCSFNKVYSSEVIPERHSFFFSRLFLKTVFAIMPTQNMHTQRSLQKRLAVHPILTCDKIVSQYALSLVVWGFWFVFDCQLSAARLTLWQVLQRSKTINSD